AFFLSFIDKTQKENKKTLLVFPDFRTLDHFSSFLENRFPLLRLIKYDSRLASRRRFLAYKLAEDGDFDVILGTRGSIFLPAQGLYYHVVLDPEDKGHYSDRPPFYDTFRLLLEKIKITGGNLEVVSLTPTLSLYHFMTTGECKKRDFPSFSRISKPSVNLVSYEKKGGSSLTFSARKAILQTLSKEGKVLIWVQKKGYTPALGCRDCGFYYVCPHCGVALRYYKKTKMLVCPLCGGKREPDLFCPRCGGVWLEGWGEGMEKVGEEIKQIFPSQEVVVMNAEKEEEAKNLPLFSILVGTSLVLREEILQEASLLIIWSLEDWLYLSDINAREKFYLSLQRIQSLLGLNSSLTPQVFIQGRKGVEKEVSRFLQSPRDFYPPILEKRKKLGYPPYGVLVHLIKRCRNREKDELVLKKLKNDLEKAGIEVGGPFPAQGRKWGEESEEMTLRYSRDKIEEVFIVISKFFSQERKSRGEWRVEVEF
ncbi:MAG: hypothetical protein PWP57_1009, partial [Candidatus Atribacteria bacterium]|nr:hypothetical protein [Candidatus Atribacteria bacterium]